jgi:hypothetical protein
MSVVVSDPRGRDDEGVAPIPDRIDFRCPTFGVTVARRHPPYVFSVRGVSCLVHKVRRVEVHWYRISDGGHGLVRMRRPVLIDQTHCAQHFRLEAGASRTCRVPSPEALLCGRCHGERATFAKRGPSRQEGITRQAAHVRLGCVVDGY